MGYTLAEGYPPFSFPLFALTTLISLPASLIVPPNPYRWILWVFIIVGDAYLAFTTTHHPVVDYFLGSVYAGSILLGSDYILLTEPQKELRLKGQKSAVDSAPLSERLRWGIRLWSSPRGVGWMHQPNRLCAPVSPDTTRLAFIRRCLFVVVLNVFLLDAVSIYNRANPAFLGDGISMADRPWLLLYVDLLAWVLTSQAQMRILHGIVSIVSVLSRLSVPRDWVDPFGSLLDAYTLRRLWGRTWHQFVNRFASSHGKYLARRVFRFPPGTLLSSLIQLYTSFATSVFLHMVADFTMFKRWNVGGSLWFFSIQPFAIMCETGVIALSQKPGHSGDPGLWTRLIGYTWVWTWFVLTFPGWFDPMSRVRFMEIGLNMPSSIILGLWKGEWWQGDV
ncbi:membrane bound O-acyl transferase family-domain-containing protein [Desarmillaria tabescens]|uniref:Membrane bound O-acyl transferase family-domain-containing protein n=1 Tax=Armillaria tabescens TaxID=1929756 RepID=A0AA39NRH2_ARMTA|nr:membrane bound O-acyl transferase family-domain-containing protein [Desarmillaria tabescens]KAK0470476.1 membrane bound O-acyl transferase family-domain-containing protein [Desarmillaria tabescens]